MFQKIFFYTKFIRIANVDTIKKSNKFKLPIKVINIIFITKINSCYTCMKDIKDYINFSNEKVNIIVAFYNDSENDVKSFLKLHGYDRLSNVYIIKGDFLDQYLPFIPMEIMFFNNSDVIAMQWGAYEGDFSIGKSFIKYSIQIAEGMRLRK